LIDGDRCVTGIEGLDNILNGGIPLGNTVLVTGTVGTGKTTLGMEFLVRGAQRGENCAFISVTEPSSKLIENMRTYDFFDDALIKAGRLHIFDLQVIYDHLGLEWGEYEIKDMEILLSAFEDIVDELSITRLAIDSITAICFQLKSRSAIRKFIFDLGQFLSTFGCTTFLISETVVEAGVEKYSVFGVEEAISDGIMLLGNVNRKGDLLRTIQVVKMRGTRHSRAKFVSDLTPDGMAVVPLLKWGSEL